MKAPLFFVNLYAFIGAVVMVYTGFTVHLFLLIHQRTANRAVIAVLKYLRFIVTTSTIPFPIVHFCSACCPLCMPHRGIFNQLLSLARPLYAIFSQMLTIASAVFVVSAN